jgi:hypothetical protein
VQRRVDVLRRADAEAQRERARLQFATATPLPSRVELPFVSKAVA